MQEFCNILGVEFKDGDYSAQYYRNHKEMVKELDGERMEFIESLKKLRVDKKRPKNF